MIHCIKLKSGEFAADYIYSSHSHKHVEIDYVLTGRCIIPLSDRNVTLSQGECIVIASNTPHGFMADGRQRCRIRQFEFDGSIEPKEAASMLSGSEQPFYKLTDCTEIGSCLGQLGKYRSENDIYKNELFSLEFRKLLVLLLRYRERNKKEVRIVHSPVIRHVLAILDERYTQEINLEQIARDHYISSSYLRRVFAREVGFSAMEYVTMLRMEHAKRLLKDTDSSISEIAVRTGYSNLQFFSSQFRHKIGIPPTVFRQQSREFREEVKDSSDT